MLNKKRIFLLTFAMVLLIFTMSLSSAQTSDTQKFYCCCDKTTKTAIPATAADYCLSTQTAIEITTAKAALYSCSSLCGAPVSVETPVCSNTKYTPPIPQIISITPIKGENKLELTFAQHECAERISKLTLKRCEKIDQQTDCEPQELREAFLTSTSSEYINENVEFGVYYNYLLEAEYFVDNKKVTLKSSKTQGYAGDVECLNRKTETPFCVFQSTYKDLDLKNYLEYYGYWNIAKEKFSANEIESSLDYLFGNNYRAAFTCDSANRKTKNIGPCGDKQICKVTSSATAACVNLDECSTGTNPFGLFYEESSCNLKSGCYYDKSSTLINKCYSCPSEKQMQCYDYKSASSCNNAAQNNKCGPSTCQWKNIYPSIGSGVCVDTSKYNCENCDKEGSLEHSSELFNSLFDKCTKEKSDALQILTNDAPTEKKCLFNSQTHTSKGCDKIVCKDYKDSSDCGLVGIQLADNNEITPRSNDYCKIGVCEFANGQCFKNSDGQKSEQKRDCLPNDDACEKDFFPPRTEIKTTNKQGATNKIYLSVYDKIEKTKDEKKVQGYPTYLCLKDSSTLCDKASEFSKITKLSELNVGNGIIKESAQGGQELFKDIPQGSYQLKYYTKDLYNNLEIIKTTPLEICSTCHTPTINSFTVSNVQAQDGKFYTQQTNPPIVIDFVNPAKLISVQISKPNEPPRKYTIPADTNTPADFKNSFTLNLEGTPLDDGEYTVEIKAIDSKGLLMEPETYKIIIDKTSPSLSLSPINMFFSASENVRIEAKLNEVGKINTASLESENSLSEYASLIETKDIKSSLTKIDPVEFKPSFSTTLLNLKDGRYKIFINAQDLAGNQANNETIFFVSKGDNKITLVAPPFGVSTTTPFNLEVHTTKKSECKYTTNTELTKEDFSKIISDFNTQNKYTHTTLFSSLTDYDEPLSLLVLCQTEDKKISEQKFKLTLDKNPPLILDAYALQDTLVEPKIIIGGVELYITNLTVSLNEPGFCQYIAKQSNVEVKRGNFFEYGLVPKQVLTTEINVTNAGEYDFEIYCKNPANLQSLPKTVKISVDNSKPLEITSTTPTVFNKKAITLSIRTNKRAVCNYKESANANSVSFPQDLAIEHSSSFETKLNGGKIDYFITCSSESETKNLTVSFSLDHTPPDKVKAEIISDSGDPFIAWKTDKLRVRFNATDSESGIKGFWYKLESGGKTVSDWTFTNIPSGEEFYISTTNEGNNLQLLNGAEYTIKVKAENTFGLNSTEVQSNKLKIDITKKPQPCKNTQQDPGELGIDCGGLCEPCPEQTFCIKNVDCSTGSCINSKCVIQTCTNGIFDKDSETDKDCGKTCTKKCDIGQICLSNSDCASQSCKTGKCAIPPACKGTDTKCGGECEDKCSEGKGCLKDTDCESNLFCDKDKTCKKALDRDQDGVPDLKDKCPDTPVNSRDKVKKDGATAGCTDEQKEEPVKPTPTQTKTSTISPSSTPSPTITTKTPTPKTPTPTVKPVTTEGKPWLKYGLIVLILAALGYGAFYAYQIFAKKPEEKSDEFPGLGPLPKQIEMPKIDGIEKSERIPSVRPMRPIKRSIMHPKIKPKIIIPKKEEYIPIEQLKERVKGRKKEDVFEKLKKYQPKKESKLEAKSDVFEKLKKYKKK